MSDWNNLAVIGEGSEGMSDWDNRSTLDCLRDSVVLNPRAGAKMTDNNSDSICEWRIALT